MELAGRISEQRKRLGMTQEKLAGLADVSLATLQAIEAGSGNPSYDLTSRLLKALGLELGIQRKHIDWNQLAALGVPLSSLSPDHSVELRPEERWILIKSACQELIERAHDIELARHREALQAFILAIKLHYPSLYKKNLEKSEVVQQILPKEMSGRIIKLYRLAKAGVESKFL